MAPDPLDTNQIKTWRSIITLIIFVITNIIVLFPFHVPIYVPRIVWDTFLKTLITFRIISPRHGRPRLALNSQDPELAEPTFFKKFRFPLNFVTAPLIADLFLLAILAIGRKEVHDGTIGSDNISPIDIMVFFLSLAYIAISIDASGLIRYLAFKVLQWGGDVGHRLFFYLYAFFFGLTAFIGNDPVILSGTAFLAYMTRVSSNIVHPRAWIHAQFAVANIASAILVSSNPTNLVLAGAFNIKFINYTANMIVPVVATGIILFPFLLYIVFANESLIPISIKMHELPEEARKKKPINPNIPHGRGLAEEEENQNIGDEEGKVLSLEEIMNPFLDKGGAAFGAVIMAAALVTLLALNAASTETKAHPAFWVTLPAAFVMFVWDLAFGWSHRKNTREIARKGREEVEYARAERAVREEDEARTPSQNGGRMSMSQTSLSNGHDSSPTANGKSNAANDSSEFAIEMDEKTPEMDDAAREKDFQERVLKVLATRRERGSPTLESRLSDCYRWLQESFPTPTAVIAHLPFALVPFAFTMFVLVQALQTKGWIAVFAFGWDHWVNKTGTIGAIGGMAFLSVLLCNFAGTNIGTTILLSRVIQSWELIHARNGLPISDRTFWATVYSMAIGVNYGAFSAAFSASLAGLLWRDILLRKHIRVRSLDFARVNLPIISVAMVVGCVVLVGEVYIMRSTKPYNT